MSRILSKTQSVCPVCLSVVDAKIIEIDGAVYMAKDCAVHGYFQTVIWRDSAENYIKWLEYGGFSPKDAVQKSGCPQSCGICCEHRQEICSAALMVTNRCNANCPVCFTFDGHEGLYEPDMKTMKEQVTFYQRTTGANFPLELCGGEPTVRDDLPEIVTMARDMGYSYIQLNTNGIRIAEEPAFLRRMGEAGLTTVYMGFDGVNCRSYINKYGRDLREIKLRALENCARIGVAVVLVPCVIPGINDGELGGIIQIAKDWMPTVKGVYFQPVSYFGIYPKSPDDAMRITIPDVLRLLEEQTNGEIRMIDFSPGNCEHPQCSFWGYFLAAKDGRLRAVTRFSKRDLKDDAAARVRLNTMKNWVYNDKRYLTIGGMAFQDAWNIDLERLKQCTIHIIGKDKKMIPLCAKYLTGIDGRKLYSGIA